MTKKSKTHIYCFDDHKALVTTGIMENVRKRFADSSRYTVFSFSNKDEFINSLMDAKDHGCCKVAILGVRETKEQMELIDYLSTQIIKLNPETGLILLVPGDKMDEIKKAFRFNIDNYVPQNDNAVLRIHNIVKKLISEHGLAIFKKRRNFSLYILLIFFLLSLILVLLAHLKLPDYF